MPAIAPENIRWRLKQICNDRIFDINQTDNYMVGRCQTAQIILNSNKASRTHSSFVVNVEGHLLVQDLKSVNGTFVNGTQIPVYVLHRVYPGDTISFGLASSNQSETDRDRHTFFEVIYTEPPIQDHNPAPNPDLKPQDNPVPNPEDNLVPNPVDNPVRNPEAKPHPNPDANPDLNLNANQEANQEPNPDKVNLDDSTTESRGSIEIHSIDSSQSSGGNITAEIQINSHDLPSIIKPKKDLANTPEDDEKSNINHKYFNDSGSKLQSSKGNKAAPKWLQKSPSPKKLLEQRKSIDSSALRSGFKRLSNPKEVKDLFESNKTTNRRHTMCDASTSKRRSIDTSEKVNSSKHLGGSGLPNNHTNESKSDLSPMSVNISRRKKTSINTPRVVENGETRYNPHEIIIAHDIPMGLEKLSRKNSCDTKPSAKVDAKLSDNSVKKVNGALSHINAPHKKSSGNLPNQMKGESSKQVEMSLSEHKEEKEGAGKRKKIVTLLADTKYDSECKFNINDADNKKQMKVSKNPHDLLEKIETIKEPKSNNKAEYRNCKKEKKSSLQGFGNKKSFSHNQKKVKIADGEEFNFSSLNDYSGKENVLEQPENVNDSRKSTKVEVGQLASKSFNIFENEDHNINEINKLLCTCQHPGTSSSHIDCPVHMFPKVLEKSFTVNQDNSVIIDITDDDDDMDVSSSQIFQLSEKVKTEVQDDTFQKIKNELAEMDFLNEGAVPAPINIDSDDDGFENTQEICAYLEDDVGEALQNNTLISKDEDEELLKILEDVEDISLPNNDNLGEENMEVSFNEDQKLSTPVESGLDISKEEILHKGKSRYNKPPIIEPHTISKKPSANVEINLRGKYTTNTNKRKKSLETPTINKKLKNNSPRIVGEPPRCDSRSIQDEFKRRNSGSRADQDKSNKEIIREERRKKLKEITDRDTPTKTTANKADKGKTVKVFPESKTSRGGFLCEDFSASKSSARPKTPTKNPASRSSPRPKTPTINPASRSSPRPKTPTINPASRSSPRPKTPTINPASRSSPRPKTPTINSASRSSPRPKTPTINPASRSSTRPKTPTINPASKSSPRPKTPTKDPVNYSLKTIDLPEPKSALSKYNLRRTKSSGDIKESLPNNQLAAVQNRYNLRHSTALDTGRNYMPHENQQNHMDKDGKSTSIVNSLSHRPQVPLHNDIEIFKQPYICQRQSNVAYHSYQENTHTMDSRAVNDPSRRLMWTNGGPRNTRKAPVRRLQSVDDVVHKMVHWLPNWLLEQVDIDASAPINNPVATKIPLKFKNFGQYYDTFSKLVLLENWQYLFKGFRESSEQPRKVKIEHVRIANDLMTLDCVCYINQKQLRQGFFYKLEDFVLLECVMNDRNNSYLSLSFGFIQKCKKTTISNNDVISIKLGQFCTGEPHTKLEFSILTRYQPNKEINQKKFPIVKLLANIRGHLMLVRAIKGLIESPLCDKILSPKINEFKFPVIYKDIIQPHALNDQQRSIVLEAASLCTGRSPGIYCIKGPPGTGKSTVIVNLVFQILFSHYVTCKTKEVPMILLAAPSNTAVDNLLSKLKHLKHQLEPAWDKYKINIKCVRIGPESSINKDLIGYSLPKLAEKHIPLKNIEHPEFKAARDRNENLFEFARRFFGNRYGHEIRMCEDLIIEKSNIICTTLNSCINNKLIEAVNSGLIKFTCCIIDEATQCHEVEALLPTILGIDKFVLVGDPRQLNATIMNRDASKLGFGESLFSRISNNFTSDPRTPIRMLTDQYRMHPEICAFPNKQFYEGKLRSFPKNVNQLPDNIKPYLVFNCDKMSASGEYTNIDEVHLIQKLLSTIFGMIDHNHTYTVGIISPYNAQKDLIYSNIKDLILKNLNVKITVNTVDSFQGSENDIIIISCVRDSTNSFLQNPNRLNVALTRAKQALYIVGNYTLFKECRPLYDLREDAKKRRLLLDIRQNPMTIDNFSRYLLKKTPKNET